MKKTPYPHYLNAVLIKHLAPYASRERIEAIKYMEKIDKKIDSAMIEKGNTKTSSKV